MDSLSVHQAFNQLVEHHRNYKEFFKEVEDGEKDGLENEVASSLYLIPAKRNFSAGIGKDVCGAVGASVAAQGLQELIAGRSSSQLMEDKQAMASVKRVIREMKVMTEGDYSCLQSFISALISKSTLPVCVLWLLHSEDLLTVEAYFTCKLAHPSDLGHVSPDVVHLCSKSLESADQLRFETVQGMMTELADMGYVRHVETDNPSSRGLKKVSCALLDNITKRLVQMYKDADLSVFSFVCNFYKRHQEELRGVTAKASEGLKRYCTRQIVLLLSLHPNLKVSEALTKQKSWSFAKCNPLRTQMYRELLLILECKEAVAILKEVLTEQEVNWESLLSFTATIVLCYDEAPGLVRALCTELIATALDCSETDGLVTGFLLARQCTIEGPHVFTGYQHWFHNTFGEQSSSLASSKKSFGFLVKFLSDIVPYESVEHLKAHIWKPPYIPAMCRPVWSDYVTLVKTRLMDLNQPIEDSSIYSEGGLHTKSSSADPVKQQAHTDVELALQSYSKNGKIPASIMEASIFRKPYYVTRFLPALLTPRTLPDHPDNKMCLIEALRKAEKLPEHLYDSYKKACQHIANSLLEGAFSDTEDVEMDNILLSPWQQYENSLKALKSSVLRASTEDLPVKGCISVVYEKMCNVLDIEDSSAGASDKIVIELEKTNFPKIYLQVLDRLMEHVCEMVAQEQTSHTWLSPLLQSISRQRHIYTCLLMRILQLLSAKITELADTQIHCLSVLCVYLVRQKSPTVTVTNGVSVVPYQQLLFENLRVHNVSTSVACFKFLTFYLEQCFFLPSEEQSDVIHSQLVKKFSFLMLRLKHSGVLDVDEETQSSDVYSTALAIYNNTLFQQFADMYKLSLSEWLAMEKMVDSAHDFYSPIKRQAYYDDMIWNEFKPAHPSDSSWSKYVCTSIAEAILLKPTCLLDSSLTGWCWECCAQQRGGDSTESLITLLQRSTSHLCQEEDRSSPWLLGFYSDLMTNNPGEINLTCALELACLLPPYLLFTNGLNSTVCCNIDEVATIINTGFSQYCSVGAVLQFPVTGWLVQATVQLHDQTRASALMGKCPLLSSSVQYYWCQLRTLVDSTESQSYFTSVGRVHEHCNRLLTEKQGIPIADSVIVRNPLQYVVAICAFLNHSSDVPAQVFEVMEQCKDSLVPHLGRTILMFKSFQLVYQENQICPCVNENHHAVLLKAFTLCPEFPCMEQIMDGITAKYWDLGVIALLKFLLTRETSTSGLWDSPNCIAAVLSLNVKLCVLYEEGVYGKGVSGKVACKEGASENSATKRLSKYIAPLDLQLLQECHGWIKQHLLTTSKAVRQSVSKDVIRSCDSDLRAAILLP